MLEKTGYVLRVDSCPGWQDYRRAATLAMCPGNENWEGEKFVTALEWAARNFDFIRIALSDTLSRHNKMLSGMDEGAAIVACQAEADSWIAAHGGYLARCGKPFEIVRWNRWLHDPEIPGMIAEIEALAASDGVFAACVAADIETYRGRLIARGHGADENFATHCRTYLFEELAGVTLRARALPRSSRLYPAREPQSSRFLRNRALAGHVTPASNGLEQEYYVSFNLRRRSQNAADAPMRIVKAA